MDCVVMTRERFLADDLGRTFSDVANDPEQPFDEVLAFFSDESRQLRMEDAELHHDRPPLAGAVRELEAIPAVDHALGKMQANKSKRLRQAIGVVVRMIMEARGWSKSGRKGSLGVRAAKSISAPHHNTGGLAFWFIRAERYHRTDGMPYQSVRQRCRQLDSQKPQTALKGR